LIDEYDATQRSARQAAATAAFKPQVPVRERERRRVKAAATLALLVLAVLGLASYEFVANAGHARGPVPDRSRVPGHHRPHQHAAAAGSHRGQRGRLRPRRNDRR